MPGHEDALPPAAPEPASADFDCPYCSHTVPAGELRCPTCHNTVASNDPLDKPAPRSHDSEIVERFEDFQTRVEALLQGNMTVEEFAIWFHDIQTRLHSKRDAFVALIKDASYYEFHPEEVEMGLSGIFDFEMGMETMADILTGDAEFTQFQPALEKMWEGTQKVNEAMRMNREFRNGLEDDWGFL